MSQRNAWSTNVEFCMLGAIAGIDTLIVDCIDSNFSNWNILENDTHIQQEVLLQCDPFFGGHKLCVLHHRFNYHLENEHFDSFYPQ